MVETEAGHLDERALVLIVDDQAELRALIRTALELNGFRVAGEAADGSSALGLVSDRSPDVVVLDLGLPDIAGLELIPRIRAIAECSIVVFTGSEPLEGEEWARQHGADHVVLKGEIEQLIATLEAVIASSPDAVERWFAAAGDSVRAARRFVHSQCARWRCDAVADDVALIASELVTHAVQHARSPLVLRLSRSGDTLRVEVVDQSPGSPSPRLAAEDAENGRGLHLVAALSHAWGVSPLDDGKVVWAEFATG